MLAEGKESQKREEPKPELKLVAAEPLAAKTRIVNTPVRSGQQIYARNADLIVTSSVSAGAELVADGNIHIYGMMRGRALAGASGDRECQIFVPTCPQSWFLSPGSTGLWIRSPKNILLKQRGFAFRMAR